MDKPKGLIFITLDCLRYDRTSFNGYKFIKHFNMEWFAKKGYVFDNMISVGVQTPQVHASYLTGKYQFEHGLRRMWGSKINPEIPTIPEMLQDRGWVTACATGFTGLADHYGLDRGFEQVDKDSDLSKAWVRNEISGVQGNDWRGWVKDFKYDEEKPLFIWLHYFFGHTGSDDVIPKKYQEVGFQREHPRTDLFKNYDGKFLWFDEKWLPVITKRFDPVDYAYIITSDHGDDFGKYEIEHGSYLYHETIHIPMIMYCPTSDSTDSRGRNKKIIQPSDALMCMFASYGDYFKYPKISGHKLPFAYSETLIDYDCGLGDGSKNKREKCFRHSVFDGGVKIIYKNPEGLGIGELEAMTLIKDKKEFKHCHVPINKDEFKKYLEMPEIENPVCEASTDDYTKKQLEGLGYM